MATRTTVLQLYKPVSPTDDDLWGPMLNTNADLLEARDLANRNYAEANAGFRNKIQNGDFRIDGRGTIASPYTVPVSGPVIDRWQMSVSQANKLTVQQIASTQWGFKNALKVTVAAAVTPAAGDFFSVVQAIEGQNLADLMFGLSGARPIGVSFRAVASVGGTYTGSVRNASGGRSYLFTFALVANTDTAVAVAIPGDVVGTWPTDNGASLLLTIDLGSGATFTGATGSWLSGNIFRASGSLAMISTLGATFQLTGVQLERLTSLTDATSPFEHRPNSVETDLCRRYYVQLPISMRGLAQAGNQFFGTTVTFPQQMRAAPTAALVGGGVTNNLSLELLTVTNANGGRFDIGSAAAGDAYALERIYALSSEI